MQSPIKLPPLSNSSEEILLRIRWDLIICDFVYLNFFIAPSQPPGNIIWNSSDSKIILNWDQVKALDNESEVKGYKVGNFFFAKAPSPAISGDSLWHESEGPWSHWAWPRCPSLFGTVCPLWFALNLTDGPWQLASIWRRISPEAESEMGRDPEVVSAKKPWRAMLSTFLLSPLFCSCVEGIFI